LALLGIEFGEVCQGIVQRHQIETSALEFHRLIEGESVASIALGSAVTARVFHQICRIN
jgi:hypothetical protein